MEKEHIPRIEDGFVKRQFEMLKKCKTCNELIHYKEYQCERCYRIELTL